MNLSDNQEAFLALLRAGLWEGTDVLETFGTSDQGRANLNLNDNIDWDKVYLLAAEQSVLGLVLAGIEKTNTGCTEKTNRPPQGLLLQWIGEVQMIEQQNQAMNKFVGQLIERLRKEEIYALLVKGQGIAQCYEKPMWRSSGDVDLFLRDDNYERAKKVLVPLASEVETEYIYSKHLGMTINGFVLELHGTLQCNLSPRVKRGIGDLEKDIIYGGQVRSWMNGKVQVFMPDASNDAIYVFSHFLNHFYKEGVGLRQICDWCRLLWTYRGSLNHGLLESRIKRMGLMSEWRAFGAFAVEYLGMPSEAMPLFNANDDLNANKKKADKICDFILEVGNMGHNRDMSYFEKYPYIIRKACSMRRRCGDLIRHARIFPLDSLRFFPTIMFNGFRSAARGE